MGNAAPHTAHLLFELGTEELPPAALQRLSSALSDGFVEGLASANLGHGAVTSYATPRRLAVLIQDCETKQADRDKERRGPAIDTAFDVDGKPTKAAEGFARSCGTTVGQLQKMESDQGRWLVYRQQLTGQVAAELLPAIAQQALDRLPIPKRMRWGDSEAEFVRPVHWLVFLLGDKVVPCTLFDIEAGKQTHGHRFHHPQAITIYDPEDYAQVLESLGKVIANFGKRRQRIEDQVLGLANELKGKADLSDELLNEVTALNEWPVALAGSFDERFLSVPHEALIATMKGNQRYFPVVGTDGRLLNHFITVANIESERPEVVREGNERVIRPRLSDAMFFWEQDGKKRLEEYRGQLNQVVFQKDLGTLREKSARVATLAAHIADHIGADPTLAQRAGELSRCDLMTHMVYEFPEMQGVMGRYQAQRDGEANELAQAMDEFYMPRFSGDRLPGSPIGIALSLADRFDTLVGIFGVGLRPTGDKDPFALRRAALGALRILREHALPLNLRALLAETERQLDGKLREDAAGEAVYGFMLERLRGLYTESGAAPDVFEAVAAVRPDSVADFEHRVRAVSDFRTLPEAEALAAANKRIANILKKATAPVPEQVDPDLFELTAEKELFDQVCAVTKLIGPMAAESNYGAMLQALSRLRTAVDRFFDDVMVMAEKPEVRANRLALLQSLTSQFLRVADVSRLQV